MLIKVFIAMFFFVVGVIALVLYNKFDGEPTCDELGHPLTDSSYLNEHLRVER